MTTTTTAISPAAHKTSGRQFEADAGRFIASVGVMIYHYGALVRHFVPDTDTALTEPVARYGYLGVPWFFLLSGYVISMSVERAESSVVFAQQRLWRIWPTLAISALTTTIFLLLSGRGVSLLTLFQNVALLPTIDNSLPNVDGTYWSLWLELRFYIVAAIVIRFRHLLKLEHVAYALIVLGALSEALASTGYEGSMLGVMQVLSLNSWAGLFGAGILFSCVRRDGKWSPARLAAIGLSALNAFPASHRAGNENIDVLDFPATNTVVLAGLLVSFYGFFVFLVGRESGAQRGWHPAAAYLGALSYPLYLIHSTIGYQLFSLLDLPFVIEASIATAVAIFLAHVILRFDQALSQHRRERHRQAA